ncbi:DUF6893 family small protein [Streptomyces sp. NPDC059176]
MMKTVIGLTTAAAACAAVVRLFPDLRRYLRIRMM